MKVDLPGQGIWFPADLPWQYSTTDGFAVSGYGGQTMDAANEGIAIVGKLFIVGRPSSAKTISSAGNGKIYIAFNTVTAFSDAGTTIRVGIQDVETAGAAPPAQPDDTFGVYGDLVGGTDSLTASTWKEVALDSGTKNLTHGQTIAFVALMTSRGGSDSVQVRAWQPSQQAATGAYPTGSNTTTGTTWSALTALPHMYIKFDDGTIGLIEDLCAYPATDGAYVTVSSNPDEYGLIFTAPFSGWVDALSVMLNYASGGDASDVTISLFSDPLGTPTSVASVSIPGDEVSNTTGNAKKQVVLFNPVQVTRGTKYIISARATSTGNVRFWNPSFASSAEIPVTGTWDTTMSRGARDGGSGAFTESTSKVFPAQMRYSSITNIGPAPTYQLGI